MVGSEQISATDLSKETGISASTLATWKSKELRVAKGIKSKRNLSSQEKFLIVMKTYSLSEIELSRYCREHGLFVSDIKLWRKECVDANSKKKVNAEHLTDELREEKIKSKALAKELRIKEKALAETVALLVLRKKLNAIFMETEED